jgi:CubicO group peptidase (beta-lactamase class C family)
LEQYYEKNIWKPLNMTHTTFYPLRFEDRLVVSYHRLPDGGIAKGPLVNPLDPPQEAAGHGIFTTPNDYAKFLGAILDGGGPLLSSKSVDEIFHPQLPTTEWLAAEIQGPYKRVFGPSIPQDQEVNHGLAGLVNLHDFPGRRSAGTLQWSGAPNLIWVSVLQLFNLYSR